MPANLFTEMTILSFDRVAFGHSLSAANYKYDLHNQGYGIYGETPDNGGVLEIGFVEQNPVILGRDDQEYFIGENCIFVIPPHCDFSVRTQNPGLHRHTSVEFLIGCRSRFVPRCDPPGGQTITLPLIITPAPESGEVFELIRAIARAKTAQANRSWFEECADFMLLMSKLAALVQAAREEDSASPGNRRYCDRAKAFISENIGRRITVSQVAAAVGVSKNYLSNIFSSSEGISLVEYINRLKLSYMMELVRRYGYTLAQAGEYVGFSDVNYISRIFKRYYGMTVSEYKRSFKDQEDSQ